MSILLSRQQLQSFFSVQFLGLSLGIMLTYLFVSMLLPNYRLLFALPSSGMKLLDALSFIFLLFIGSFSAYSLLENTLMITIGILVGLNLALYFTSLYRTLQVKTQAALGGQTFLGVALGGCSSCGTSLLSMFAGSLGIGIAPLQIHLLQVFTILLLCFSLFYTLQKNGVCTLKR